MMLKPGATETDWLAAMEDELYGEDDAEEDPEDP
jgi:hypothetical protein